MCISACVCVCVCVCVCARARADGSNLNKGGSHRDNVYSWINLL